MILHPADTQRRRGRPAPSEHPRRVVEQLSGIALLVRDEPDAAAYVVRFATPEMLAAFLSRLEA